MIANTPNLLLNHWKRRSTITLVASASLMTLVLFVLFKLELLQLPILIGGWITSLLAIYSLHKRRQPNINDALDLAHNQNPNIEYSAQLLLDDDTKGLALIQKNRTKELFGSVLYRLPWDSKLLIETTMLIASFAIGSIALQQLFNPVKVDQQILLNDIPSMASAADSQNILDTAYVQSLRITETPPQYTGLTQKTHSNPNIQIVEGATVNWKAVLSGTVDIFYFLYSKSDTIDITNNLKLTKKFDDSDFYQYGFNSHNINYASDYFSLKVIKDQKPKVIISGIDEYVRLSWGSNHNLSFNISLSDDYGLTDAYISATIAKGSGEAVKFRERKFELNKYNPGNQTYQGKYAFSTAELKMEPGDELYFYVRVKDNYPYAEHWSKSVTHFVSIVDTTNYEFADEGGMQVDLMPDFFRSQRQIIIDSEKLLSQRSSISVDSFKRASNALGYDQKMLRLKYGQFLGEENESGIAINNELEDEEDHDHEDHSPIEGLEGPSKTLESARDLLSQYMHDHDHEEEEGQLMSTKGTESKKSNDPSRPTWVEELSHNHDDGEVTSFLDISVKSKLRTALSVMWDAELHLRLYDPTTSLPFQYEALGLLQEIKNHARIYVQRIGFDPPSIKEGEVRLFGDQKKIDNRLNISEVEEHDDYRALKNMIESLGSSTATDYKQHLDSAIEALAKISLSRSEVLPVLSLANNIKRSSQTPTDEDLSLLRGQLIKVLPPEATSIKGTNKYAHELTLSVAKKISF